MQRISADQPEKESAEIRYICVIRVSIRLSIYGHPSITVPLWVSRNARAYLSQLGIDLLPPLAMLENPPGAR